MSIDDRKAFVASCPRKVFSFDTMRQAVDIEDINKCNLCNECNKYAIEAGHPNVIKIDEIQNRFIFTVESTGALTPQHIVREAIQVLKQKLGELSRLI